MRAILKQTIANLSTQRLQAALILTTLTAAAALLTLALTTFYATQGAYDRLFQRTSGAHLWLTLDATQIEAEETRRSLAELTNVEATTPIMHTISGTLFLGEIRLGGIHLREWPMQAMIVDEHLFLEGRPPDPDEEGVILLDRDTAKAYQTNVGDTVYILTPNGRTPLQVIGLFINSNICPAANCWPPVSYLFAGVFQELGLSTSSSAQDGTYEIGLRLSVPENLKEVLNEVERILPPGALSNWHSLDELRATADGAIRNWKILLISFSVVAGLAGALLIANTLTEAIRGQTRRIGLLKTVGFTNAQVRAIYLAESLTLSLIAAVLGLILGGFSSALILKSIAEMFAEKFIFPPAWIALAVPVCTSILASIASLLPTRRAVQKSIVDAIRFGFERPRQRSIRFPFRSPVVALSAADTFSYPLRSTLTGLGLGMAVLTFTAALILNNTFNKFLKDPSYLGFDGDLFVYRTAYIADEEVRGWIEARPEILSYYVERWGQFRFNGEEEVMYARFRGGNLAGFTFPLIEGRLFESDDEVVLGYGLLQERNLQVGDEIWIDLEGESRTFKVVGSYRENSNMGRMLMLPLEVLQELLPHVEVYNYVLKVKPDADPKTIADELVTETHYLTEVNITGAGGLPADIVMSKKVMLGLSLLMSMIAGIGVLSSLWMNIQERQREFGILKAIGMTPRQISLSVITSASGIALLGIALGLPVGILGVRQLIDIVARQVGFGPLQAPIDPLGLAIILPVILIVAILGALIPARRAANVSVVDMLRYE